MYSRFSNDIQYSNPMSIREHNFSTKKQLRVYSISPIFVATEALPNNFKVVPFVILGLKCISIINGCYFLRY